MYVDVIVFRLYLSFLPACSPRGGRGDGRHHRPQCQSFLRKDPSEPRACRRSYSQSYVLKSTLQCFCKAISMADGYNTQDLIASMYVDVIVFRLYLLFLSVYSPRGGRVRGAITVLIVSHFCEKIPLSLEHAGDLTGNRIFSKHTSMFLLGDQHDRRLQHPRFHYINVR